MEIKDTTNPIGTVRIDESLQKVIDSMKALWDRMREKVAWWQIWKTGNMVKITDFLIKCLDDLIAYVDQKLELGPDKKATVLKAVEKIFDYIVREAVPIWVRPFLPAFRRMILGVIIPTAIDWIVEKYRNGSWRPKPSEEIVAQWLTGVPGGGILPRL